MKIVNIYQNYISQVDTTYCIIFKNKPPWLCCAQNLLSCIPYNRDICHVLICLGLHLSKVALYLTQPWWWWDSQPLSLHVCVCLHRLSTNASSPVTAVMAPGSILSFGRYCIFCCCVQHLPLGAYLCWQSTSTPFRYD